MSLQKLAQQVRTKGRHGDTELVHMTKGEVAGLHSLARAMYGRDLPVNPETGLHEANWLKKFLPSLIGGAVGGLTGSNALGSLAGAAVGGYQARKGGGENVLAGLLAGGTGGYGASQLAQGFSAAAQQGLTGANALDVAKEAGPLQPAVEEAAARQLEQQQQAAAQADYFAKAKAGINALMTPEGQRAFAGTAATKDAAATGAGGNLMQSLGRAALPMGMADPAEQAKANKRPGSDYVSPYAGGTGKWAYDAQGVLRWTPGTKGSAAGGTVGYADGGVPDEAEGNEGQNISDAAWAEYLFGGGEEPRVRARRVKTTPRVQAPQGGGGGGEPSASGNDAGTGLDMGQGMGGKYMPSNVLGVDLDTGPEPEPDPVDTESSYITAPTGERIPYWDPRINSILTGMGLAAVGGNPLLNLALKPLIEKQLSSVTSSPVKEFVPNPDAAPNNEVFPNDGEMVTPPMSNQTFPEIQPVPPANFGSAGSGSTSGASAGTGASSSGGYGGVSSGGYGESSEIGGMGGSFSGDYSDWGSGGGTGGLKGYDYTHSLYEEGGTVALQSGGFVIPADVVAALGAGSSSAGLELLAQRLGAKPIAGKGHGQSDDIPATIDGTQEARVARDEMVLDAEQVARIGGGDPKKGAKKLYDMMSKVRKQATGSPKQMRPVNVDKVLS